MMEEKWMDAAIPPRSASFGGHIAWVYEPKKKKKRQICESQLSSSVGAWSVWGNTEKWLSKIELKIYYSCNLFTMYLSGIVWCSSSKWVRWEHTCVLQQVCLCIDAQQLASDDPSYIFGWTPNIMHIACVAVVGRGWHRTPQRSCSWLRKIDS